jgi:outer membrane protein assembly factor BamB
VTDGERVIASFGSAGLFCYNLEGKELWRRDLGKQEHIWGNGAAPILHGNLCILNFGPGERTFLIAVDKKSGETVWQVAEAGGHSGLNKPGETGNHWLGSWVTPIIVQEKGREELIMNWPNRVAASDPATGKELWSCRGLNALAYASPLFADGVVVAMGGFNGDMLAVKAGGAGDVSAKHRLWLKRKTKQRIGSGVINGEHIYILNEPGVAECIELQSGKTVWEERLAGKGPDSTSWSSMVLAEGKLYVLNHSAETFVLKAKPSFELVAVNSLEPERTEASIVPAGGELLIRTHQALWCIGAERPTARQ